MFYTIMTITIYNNYWRAWTNNYGAKHHTIANWESL